MKVGVHVNHIRFDNAGAGFAWHRWKPAPPTPACHADVTEPRSATRIDPENQSGSQ